MIDSFVLLAPILLLAVMALLRFVGCNWVWGLEETTPTPTVIVIPNAVTLGPAQTQLFTATVNGVQSSNVAWSADPAGVGILDTSGFYRAPPSLSADQLVTITAMGAQGGSGTAAVTLKAPAFTPIRVDCGSLMGYTDAAGQVWSADSNPPPGTMVFSNPAAPIANTNDPQLYRSLRYGGNFQYQFSVPNSNAIVTLKFAEISFTTAGQRVFNVAINGTPVLSNFDIALEGGGNAAVDKSFVIAVTGGQITIQFSTGPADLPAVNAIEIVSA